MADGTLGERNLRRHSQGQAYALLGCEGPPYHPNEGGAEGVEPRIRGDGGLPAGPMLTAPGRTEGSPFIPTGQPSGSPESVPSAATAQSPTACDGRHHMGSLLLAIYGGALQEGTWHGAKHGSSPSYSPALPPESLLSTCMAGVRHTVPHRASSLDGQGLDIRRSVTVCSMPARAEASRGPLRHGGGRDTDRAEGKRQVPSAGRRGEG